MLKCKRNGCRQEFDLSNNPETGCKYHPGKPLFHDTKKGWTCCNKVVYDWDEFQKIPTCAIGSHCAQEKTQIGQDGFFKSDTLKNAESALQKGPGGIVIKSIDQQNKKFEEQKRKKELEKGPLKAFVSPQGKFRCINKGCNKFYVQEQNKEGCCSYHTGNPVFHDVKKFWTCCKKEVWDWDEFVKLPTCAVGLHSPKMV